MFSPYKGSLVQKLIPSLEPALSQTVFSSTVPVPTRAAMKSGAPRKTAVPSFIPLCSAPINAAALCESPPIFSEGFLNGGNFFVSSSVSPAAIRDSRVQ